MANTYKDIVITPNKGSSTDDPKIVFSGGNTSVNTDITLRVYPDSNGTLSFEGSAGQLFSVTNDLTGSLFTVNDVSGIPSIEVDALGNVDLAPFGGNVGIGTSNPVYKLDVQGDARITGNLTLGDATTDTITVNAANFNLANNISFDSGTLFIDKNNDRIGIGTSSPTSKLTINGGGITGQGSGLFVNNGDITTARSSSTGAIYFGSDSATKFLYHDGTAYYFGSTGNVITPQGYQAAIYYDTNSNYYIDADGGSKINNLQILGAVSATTNTAFYYDAALEVRELNLAGAQADIANCAPRIGMHWGGRVASQIVLESSGRIAIRNNPGNGYEAFAAGATYLESAGIAGNLGVGTTSPTTKLHVKGTVNGNEDLLTLEGAQTGTGVTGILFKNASAAPGSAAIRCGPTPQDPNGGRSLTFLGDVNGTLTERMRIDNSGNVSIGTTSTSARLQVVGASSSANVLYLNVGGNYLRAGGISSGSISLVGFENNVLIGNEFSGGDLVLVAGANERMRIRSGGSVGIGTSSPSESLHVAGGAIRIGSDASAGYLNIKRDNSTGYFIYDAAQASPFRGHIWQLGGSETMRIDANGNIGIGTSSPITKLHIQRSAGAASLGEIFSSDGTYWTMLNSRQSGTAYSSLVQGNDHAIIYSDGSADTGAFVIAQWSNSARGMRIDSSGNVGIGTASPASKLDVTSSTNSSIILIHTALTGSGATNGFELSVGDNASWIWNYENTPIIFGANDAESMRITSGGNVGIGTTNPDAKLHVLGGAIMPAVGSTSSSGIQWPSNPGGGAGDSAFIRYYAVSGESTKFVIGTDNDADDTIALYQQGADRLTVYNGNIGIGTSSPSVLLELGGQATPQVRLLSTTNAVDTRLLSIGAGNAGIVGTYSNHDLSIYANAAERMRITSGGNVGIGTTSPRGKLDVYRHVTHTHEWASKTYTGGSWYRFLTLNATNQGQELRVVLRNPNGHDSVEITIAKHTTGAGNAGVVASIRRLGSYAYTHNITKIRICDDGTNSTTHLEVQFGANHTSTLNMGLIGLISEAFTVVDMTTGAVGSSSTKELFVSDGVSATTNQTMIGYSTLSNDLMYLNTNGNLGIGTTSPGHKLSIGAQTGGTSTATPDTISIGSTYSSAAGTNAKLRLFWDGAITYGFGVSSSQLDYIVSGAYSHVWYSNGSERMRLLADGNLGIANTSPGHKLSVNGTAYFGGKITSGIGGGGSDALDFSLNDAYASFRVIRNNGGLYNDGMYIGFGNAGTGTTKIYGGGAVSAALEKFSNYTLEPGSFRAPIFYNSGDLNVRWSTNDFVLRGGSPTIWFRDTDHNSAMIHCNSNLLYILRGGTDTETWSQVNGVWPFYINLTNNDATFGGSIFTSLGSMYAKRFYDNDNTAYFVDPADTSVLNAIAMYGALVGRTDTAANVSAANDTGSMSIRGSTTAPATVSFHRAGAYAINMGLDTDNIFKIGGWSDGANTYRLQLQGPGGTHTFNGNVTLTGALTVQTGGGTITGGFIVAPGNLGTISSGTTTLSPTTGNYQYYTNNGAHTIAAPGSDCAIDVLVTNGASAGTITLSGFTAPTGGGSSTPWGGGDLYATTNAQRFLLMVRRINGISTFSWKALQ